MCISKCEEGSGNKKHFYDTGVNNSFDFDQIIDRKDTASYKWDGLDVDSDVLPMWVADMDFACPPPVVEAVRRRAQHPIYGYPIRTERYFKAVEGWLKNRHGFDLPRKYLTFSPPGVIYAMNTALKLLTGKGDKVLVHAPNYDPLYIIVTDNHRILVESPLKQQGDRFIMDFEDIERKAKCGLSALILCSPHNPTGRVWTGEELERVADICLRYDISMLVDEIHADFTTKEYPHTAFGKLGDSVLQKSVICYSANKGFNLGGFQMSTVIIANDALREKFNDEMDTSQTRLDNIFGAEAMIAAYEQGDAWLDAAISYVEANKAYVRDYLERKIPKIKWTLTEGTYFGWLDCKGLGIVGEDLEQFMIDKARVAFSPGYGFGPGGEAFMRMNLACPISIVKEAMQRLDRAVSELQ